MYYKIIDQQSEAYQKIKAKLDELKDKKQQADKILKETVEFEWNRFLSFSSPWNIVGQYAAFQPVDDNYTPEKHWKPYSKQFPRCFEPNTRTKKGKELKERIDSIPGMMGFCHNLFPKMELHHTGSGTLHICNHYEVMKDGTILIQTHRAVETLGELLPGMIEITSVEFNQLQDKES